jgi:hypothetical protein
MKKYLFGILAVALAIGFSAFTKPVKTTGTVFYHFDATQGFDDPNKIEDESNWIYDGATGISCPESDVKACSIEVSDTYVINGTNALSSSVDVKAEQGSMSGIYRVTLSGSNVTEKINRTN